MSPVPILIETKPTAGDHQVLFSGNANVTASGTVFCMNQGTDIDRVNVALVPAGQTLEDNCWIAYQSTLHHGHSLYLQQICLGGQDNIVVSSSNGTTSFIFTGTAGI